MSERCERTSKRRSEWLSTLRVDFISFEPAVERSSVIEKKTSCPKASRGQRYPCPAISCGAKARCRQGSGPNRGRCPVEHRGKFRPSIRTSVCPSVRPSIHPGGGLSQPPDSLSQPWGGTYGRTDGRTDGRTEFSPCVLQDIIPYWVRCPAYI